MSAPPFPWPFIPISRRSHRGYLPTINVRRTNFCSVKSAAASPEDFMGRWGSAGWVTRVSTFVGGGVPLNTTGNLVSHDATKICGHERRWERKREEDRVPENYGDRGKRTRAIYVEHLRAASLLPADYSRKERDRKTRRIGREIIMRIHAFCATLLHGVYRRMRNSSAVLYPAQIEYNTDEVHIVII